MSQNKPMLSPDDLVMMCQVIDLVGQKGGITGDQMSNIGMLNAKLKAILGQLQEEQKKLEPVPEEPITPKGPIGPQE